MQKRTENKYHLGRAIFFVQFSAFYIKEFTRQKKLQINYTHKCSMWVVVRQVGTSERKNET